MTTIDLPSQQAPAAAASYRFTRNQYYAMADLGWFQDKRVELIDGEIIPMPPQKSAHFLAINILAEVLGRVFERNHWIRAQGPLWINDASELEPDISVVTGDKRSYIDHPRTALLIVEVSDSTLRTDRKNKSSLYASAAIADYWILNLRDRCLEVFRDPIADPDTRFGHRYKSLTTLKPPDSISPLAAPTAQIPIADLLP